MPETIDLKLGGADLDLSQYFGAWAVEPTRFRQMLAHLQSVDLAAHVAANKDRDHATPPREMVSQEGYDPETQVASEAVIAVLSIDGTMTKRGSSYGAGSSVLLRKEIRQAANDKGVDAILLVVDSPGGTVAGTADLAAEIRSAAARKPTYCQIEDNCCSAAYWAASQATRIYANDRTALVGSIGTYLGVYDESERFSADGVRPVLIATGEHKGAGFPGTEITETHKAHFQDIVDQIQQSFADAVTSGRQMSAEELAEMADGKVWLADKAVELRLIDGVQSRDATLVELARQVSKQRGTQRMAAATYEELKAECVGADAAFLCSQLDEKVELDQARRNWMAEQNRRLQAAKQRSEDDDDPDSEEEEREQRKRSGRRGKRSEDEEPEDPDAEEEEPKQRKRSKRRGKAEEDEDDPEAEDDDEEESDAEEEDEEAKSLRRLRRLNQRRRPGVAALRYGRGARPANHHGDPVSAWEAEISEKLKIKGMTRERAVCALVKENPELHEAYLKAHNRQYQDARRRA